MQPHRGSGVQGSRLGAAVRWPIVGRMAVGWLLTLPAAAIVGGLAALIAGTGTAGLIVVLLLLIAGSTGIWLLSRRNRISPDNVNDAAEVTVLSHLPVTDDAEERVPAA